MISVNDPTSIERFKQTSEEEIVDQDKILGMKQNNFKRAGGMTDKQLKKFQD